MSGDYYNAIDSYTHAINLDPAMHGLPRQGNGLRRTGPSGQALQDYNAAVILLPNDAGAYVDRGLVHELRGNYELALRDYSWAIQLDPANATAYSTRERLYELGRHCEGFR